MAHVEGNRGEIHELARYEVRPEALDEVIAAIHEFVAYVRGNEPGALRYEVWQESKQPLASYICSCGATKERTVFMVSPRP